MPHAIRILERDSAADLGNVRDSAVKGMAEIEGIIHARLPAQKPPMPLKPEDGDDEDSSNGDVDRAEEMITETITEEMVVDESEVKQSDELPSNPISISRAETSNTFEMDVASRSLPSFITESQPQIQSVLSTKISKPSTSESGMTRVDVTTTVKRSNTGNDVFSMGAWKDIQAKVDEEEDEIPEIDMEFDSDEE